MEINKVAKFRTLFVCLLCLAIASIIILEIILGLLPPIARDALIHHLAIPKLWLINGGFYEIKWAEYSYYPMNVDLLYLISLYFHNDNIPNFIHLGFGIGTAGLIYNYLRSRFGPVAGLSGALLFLSTPIVVRLSTVAYVDLGLTFFLTASIMAFIRWRSGKYQENKWLVLSAITMGLALGTKYNALVAWFFISLAVVFIYSRDTKIQGQAVKYGAIFFLISLIVFSPWLIKNLILTGNPLFPLFKGLFTALSNNSEGAYSVTGNAYRGLFQMREMMYGEGFWETLLIPIRFFFQGQDHSDRYFDGVLNPLLILFIPFVFLNKSYRGDKVFLAMFAFFIIVATFFLDNIRIRYIMPAIPILAIISIIGIINFFGWSRTKIKPLRYACLAVAIVVLIVCGIQNIKYIKNYFQSLQPLSYLGKSETRDTYLKRNLQSYPAIEFINKNTPAAARIRLFFLAGRGYYLNRVYQDDASFGMGVINSLVANSNEDRLFRNYLSSLDCTHFLMRMDMFIKFLKDNYSPETIELLFRRLGKETELMYQANGYGVYRIITSR